MYKEAVVSVIIIILIFFTDYMTHAYTEKKVVLIKDELQNLKETLLKEDYENAENEIENIENDWNDIKDKFACFIEHTELSKIEISFTLCKSLTKSKKYDLAISKLDETIFVLGHLSERYKLSLENIF